MTEEMKIADTNIHLGYAKRVHNHITYWIDPKARRGVEVYSKGKLKPYYNDEELEAIDNAIDLFEEGVTTKVEFDNSTDPASLYEEYLALHGELIIKVHRKTIYPKAEEFSFVYGNVIED